MPVVSRTLSAGAAIVALGAGAAAGASGPPDSGVRGLVLYGPTCPVQRAGQTCERPYQATIVVRREPSNKVAVRAHSASNGRFSARLPPGRYELEAINGNPFPRALSHTITVRAHKFAHVTIRVDSGIR